MSWVDPSKPKRRKRGRPPLGEELPLVYHEALRCPNCDARQGRPNGPVVDKTISSDLRIFKCRSCGERFNVEFE